jgi:hypothetical protein
VRLPRQTLKVLPLMAVRLGLRRIGSKATKIQGSTQDDWSTFVRFRPKDLSPYDSKT